MCKSVNHGARVLSRRILLPLLKVSIDRGGRLRLPNHALDTDPEWWGAVLSDPRLRSRGGDGWQDRLDRHRGEELILSCAKCGKSGRHQVDDLIVRYGGACPCNAAAARIVDDEGQGCRHGRECGLTYKSTNEFTLPRR